MTVNSPSMAVVCRPDFEARPVVRPGAAGDGDRVRPRISMVLTLFVTPAMLAIEQRQFAKRPARMGRGWPCRGAE